MNLTITCEQAGIGRYGNRCCDCGTALLALPTDIVSRQALCSGCANRLSSAEIVRRSHVHDSKGHAQCAAWGGR